MNDKTTQEGAAEDDIKVVEVDNIEAAHQAEEEAQRVADEAAKQAANNEDDDDDDDARLAESDEDGDDEIINQRNRERRRNRREMQRRARERKDQQIDELARQNEALARRLAQIEGTQLTSVATTLENDYDAARREIERAEAVLAAAVEAGNGADTAAAIRARDAARDRAMDIRQRYAQVTSTLEAHRAPPQTQQPPAQQPMAAVYGRAWLEANTWYDPNGGDEVSAITRVIDQQVARDGFDPNTREYWQEVTRRVNERFADGGEPREKQPARKQAPPTGTNREHVPATTRNEVYVTPERKQAMIDAGVWDDPVARARYLKAYRDFDRGSAR